MNAPDRVIRIGPRRNLLSIDWGEIWAYRELLYFLVWRDVKVRYKQTILGAGWALLQPAMTTVVLAFVFGRYAGLPSDGVPYPLFALAGLLLWQYLAAAVNRSATSVVNSSNLVSKVYFPRVLIPLAAASAPLVDLLAALCLLIPVMVWYGIAPTWRLILVFPIVLLAFATALSISVWLSALHVRYRDVAYLVPFVVQIWMYLSPVVYPSSMLPDRWRLVFALNPLVTALDGFRWAVLGGRTPPPVSALTSVAVVIVIAVGGLLYFHATEDTFTDII